MIPLEFAVGLIAGLTVAGLLYVALWWWTRRTVSSLSPPAGALVSPSSIITEPSDTSSPTFPDPVRAELAPSSGPAPISGPAVAPPSAPPDRRPAVGASGSRGAGAPTEVLRLSQRVILHIYAQGDLPRGAVAPPGFCQSGIGEALGISQGGLAAVLRRLEAAGILTTERGHVRGRDRRLKIYRLSSRGLELARELRARAAASTGDRISIPKGSGRPSSTPLLPPRPSPRVPG